MTSSVFTLIKLNLVELLLLPVNLLLGFADTPAWHNGFGLNDLCLLVDGVFSFLSVFLHLCDLLVDLTAISQFCI